ncbi:MAG TPA: DUF202 domain-containing protein [Prolixibacteraceae bacterium]|nr:DUF202 domain-containing protein [Prolixibacteraceae bacterium]
MTELKEKNSIEKTREHLANERTFLAWIRTSIALMGFGFVIVKFTFFMKHISLLLDPKNVPPKGYSAMIGVILVVLGLLIASLAFLQYKKTEKQLNRNYYSSSSWMTMFVMIITMTGGILLTIYLLTNINFI